MSLYRCERCRQDKQDDDSPMRLTRMPDEAADVPTCLECAEDMTPEPGETTPVYCSKCHRPHCRRGTAHLCPDCHYRQSRMAP